MITAIILASVTAFGPSLIGAQDSGIVSLVDADTKIVGQAANDTAGWSVASEGDVNGDGVEDLIVGVPRLDTEAGQNAGAAYVFFGPVPEADDLTLDDADVELTGVATTDWAGWSVASAGDLNDDGFDDVLVGAPLNDDNAEQGGAVYVVYGGESFAGSMSLDEADVTMYGDTRDRAGWSVSNTSAVAGSETGVVVGAPTDGDGGDEAGAVFLVGAGDLPETVDLEADADAKLIGEDENDHAGWAVASAGDVNDDGTADVIVGANQNDEAGEDAGAAYLVYGGVEGVKSLADADVRMVGESSGDEAGYSVSDAGDVNDDGVDDVLVGAPLNDAEANNSGAAYVVFGGEGLPGEIGLADTDVKLSGEAEGDLAGWSVARADRGVVDCNDVEDVLVGAPGQDTTATDAGAAYGVRGGESLASMSLSGADRTFLGEAAGDGAGHAVSDAGDVSDDGVDDVVIGAPREDTAAENAGAAYVVQGECPERAPGPGYGYGYGYESG